MKPGREFCKDVFVPVKNPVLIIDIFLCKYLKESSWRIWQLSISVECNFIDDPKSYHSCTQPCRKKFRSFLGHETRARMNTPSPLHQCWGPRLLPSSPGCCFSCLHLHQGGTTFSVKNRNTHIRLLHLCTVQIVLWKLTPQFHVAVRTFLSFWGGWEAV